MTNCENEKTRVWIIHCFNYKIECKNHEKESMHYKGFLEKIIVRMKDTK